MKVYDELHRSVDAALVLGLLSCSAIHMAAHDESPNEIYTDVVVIGGGLSGVSSAIHLARGGLSVTMLEPQTVMPPIVGESLDWSAPGLLAALGLPMDELIACRAANWKSHIVIHKTDGTRQTYQPGAWLAERPWNVEIRTLHLDRPQIHSATETMAADLGVLTLREKAVSVEQKDDRIVAVQTSSGRRIRASWFIDASGAASSFLARHFRLRSDSYGPRKVALWAHIPVEHEAGGTNLYMLDPLAEYMEWIWEIPIRCGISSIGFVLSGQVMKSKRARGMTNAQIYQEALQGFPRLQEAADTQAAGRPCSTSFRCRTYRDTCGPNWMIVGEAASQSDPITGNGVTAALRHAAEASAMVLRFRDRRRIPLNARRAYSLRVLAMGRFFNCLIEKMFYQQALRARIGVFAVARAYTVPAWLTNLVYSRTEPRRFSESVAFASVLASLRAAAWFTERAGTSLGRGLPSRRNGLSGLVAEQPHTAEASSIQ